MRYPSGQPVRLATTVRDVSGVLIDAAGLALTLRKPDGSSQTYATPVHDSTGTYHQDLAAADLSVNGHYLYVWAATGVVPSPTRGELDVYDPFEPAILTLADAKDALNVPQATTAYDSRIQVWLDTVAASIEAITGGPAFNRTITERTEITRNFTTFVLRKRPVVSVASVTDVYSGTPITVTDLDIDTNSGIVKRTSGLPFFIRSLFVTVTYTAGWGTVVPAAFASAARIIISHLWETQRVAAGRQPIGLEEVLLPGMGYAVPNQALEVLRPYTLEAFV